MISDKELAKIYVDNFTELEQKAYKIAQIHLKTSFDLERSNGFLQFKKEYLKKNEKDKIVS